MIIRPYKNSDREAVRFVCLNSNGPCKLKKWGRNFILTTYCDYFIECEGENCFVVADDNDNAVGYVICAENYDRYREKFLKDYVPRISKFDVFHRKGAKLSTFIHAKHKQEYPAHLHIDILPEYQRMGLGHKLIDTLCAHLKEKGIQGVMLTAAESNKKGVPFYQKYGFTLLERTAGDVAFGLKLQ